MQADEVYIRRLRRADYPALVELIRQTWYADQTDGDTGGHEPADRARRHSVAWRLAAIDAHDCLARATHAAVAEQNGRVLGVILGSIPMNVTRAQVLRHRLRQARLALPMLASGAGRNGLCEQLGILHADRTLTRTVDKTYQAEIGCSSSRPKPKGMVSAVGCSPICLTGSRRLVSANISSSPTPPATTGFMSIKDWNAWLPKRFPSRPAKR